MRREKVFGSKFNIYEKEKAAEIVDEHEHIVDIEAPEVKERIEQARELFNEFYDKYAEDFDLGNPQKIEKVIEEAEKESIFEKAKEMRELIYNKNISIYGVCYLSNKCDQNCRFCPMGQISWKKWQYEKDISRFQKALDKPELLAKEAEQNRPKPEWLKRAIAEYEMVRTKEEQQEEQKSLKEQTKIVLRVWDKEIQRLQKGFKTLDFDIASRDLDALVKVGHQEICILGGSDIAYDPLMVVKYSQMAIEKPGIKEVILNMGAYDEKILRFIRENLDIPDGVQLQFRIFQETYDRKEYKTYMGRAPKQKGSKTDFDFRYNSQVEALKAGFDEVGIGALFGLSKYPLKEIRGLQEHADFIKREGGKEPKRCCLPLANEPKASGVEIKYKIPGMENQEKITELIYALSRLAMPTISIVSSERDTPQTLKILDQYSNHTTLFVHPAPGGNIESLRELEGVGLTKRERPIEQAESHSRFPSEALESWQKRGYHILHFDTSK